MNLQNSVLKLKTLIPCICFIFLCVSCSSPESSQTDSEPTVYHSIDELLFDPQFSDSPDDGLILEATVAMPDFVIGILYNPEPKDEFLQFFFAQIVDGGYVLDTLSAKQSAKSDYNVAMEFFDGAYTARFAIGAAELAEHDQLLDSIVLSNGKTIKIALSFA